METQELLKILEETEDKVNYLSSLGIEELCLFIKNNREYCEKNNIHPYEIIENLSSDEQIQFVSNLENIGLTLDEKREILAMLKNYAKNAVYDDNWPAEYKKAIYMPVDRAIGTIIVDLMGNLEEYRGLDNIIRINPENFQKDEKAKFMELCDICPNLQVANHLSKSTSEAVSTASEYKEAEEWIDNLVNSLNPEYSDVQKLAIIDNALGKKVSYSPDFETEVSDKFGCRALWKIISSGYGVCNGIARVEQYVLRKVGIDSEIVSSQSHAFLKIKNIELPLENGEMVKGNTILDPTWNLIMHKISSKPDSFCISYQEARDNDIDMVGTDSECHKNDIELRDATIGLDDKSLRNVFSSVGLASPEGKFSASAIVKKSMALHEKYANQPKIDIQEQFLLLASVWPDFAKCQHESMKLLSDILLDDENLNFNKCVVDRVYEREDKSKRAVMYVYVDLDGIGKKFYVADRESGRFIELEKDEFVEEFECYDMDLQKNNGVRPWETEGYEKDNTDLSMSSGEVKKEGDLR